MNLTSGRNRDKGIIVLRNGDVMIVNYKMILQYDGTRYNGWQKQGNTKNTIQGKIEEILSKYFGQEIELHGSGRTDAGVHAVGQVANFKVEYEKVRSQGQKTAADMKNANLCGETDVIFLRDELNSFLPEDIKILSLSKVDNRFHARLNASSKEYRYYISLEKKRDVFGRKYMAVLEHPEKLDIEKMKNAATRLLGEHDFQGFSDNKSKKSTIRRIDNIEFRLCNAEFSKNYSDVADDRDDSSAFFGGGRYIEIIFRGNGFLYHTIRLIVGTLLAVGMGEVSENIIDDIFDSRDRKKVPYMAPAEGLFLYKVEY